jgi:subtilisin family serine protease
MTIRRSLVMLAALAGAGAITSPARADDSRPAGVIVKLRADGPHAVTECAETLTRRGEPLARASADHSDSLDVLHRALGVRSVRAVFRTPDGSPLAAERRRLARRLERARERRAERARARGAAELPAARPLAAAEGLEHVYRVELPAGTDVSAAVAGYAADPHVEYAQPDFAVALDLLDDPYLTSQGSWGQPYADLWGLHRIGAPAAWERTQGEGVVVAVADTGIDYEHPDIAANAWINPGEDLDGNGAVDPEDWNGIDDDGNGFIDDLRGFDFFDSIDANQDGDYRDPGDVYDPDPYDESGHGTHVAGIVAARGGNGIGIAGVAPRAQVMAVRILGPGGTGDTASAWRGVLYAAENGADVINASWSCSPRCPENPIAEQVVRLVTGLGSVFVDSAGNTASDIARTSPEKLRETIAVGSFTPDGDLAASSSFGLLMDVVAPGQDVLSLRAAVATPPPSRAVGDAYLRLSGTSMATPHVAGAVALLLAERPGLGYEEVRAILRQSAEDLGTPGHDRRFGAGLLRPDLALVAAVPDAHGAVVAPGPGETLSGLRRRLDVLARTSGADLAAHAVELGSGVNPEVWRPLPAAGSDAAGATRHPWEIAGDPDGAYVVRLRLETTGGQVLTEFAPVALDRNPPRLVSADDGAALRPVVSDGRVVWEVRRPAEDALDLDLVLGAVDGEEGSVLVSTPEYQREPAMSGPRVVWQEGPPGPPTSEIRMCRLHGRHPACDPVVVAGGAAARGRPSVSGRRIVYHEIEEMSLRLELCELERGDRTCRTRRVAAESTSPSRPFIDGRRLLWLDRRAAVLQLVTCRLDARTGACPEVATSIANPFGLIPLGLSGDVVAWYERADPIAAGWRLRLCRLDADTGACPAIEVATGESPFDAAALSGRRLVWHAGSAPEPPDVFFCVLAGARCTPQRITSELGEQANPSIDGRDVVWQDDRTGFQRIAALVLPELAPLRDRRVMAGETVAFAVHALAPEKRGLEISAHTASGAPVEVLGARIDPTGPRHAVFRWRPRARHVGEHVLRFRAERPGGLFDEREVRIEVGERKGSHGANAADR